MMWPVNPNPSGEPDIPSPGLKSDEKLGIEPTLKEIRASLRRTKGYAEECRALVDELFPEDEDKRKPQGKTPVRMWGQRGETT